MSFAVAQQDPNALAPAPDEYEAEYMPGGGQVLHRSKIVARRMALLMTALGVLMGVLALVSFFNAPLVAAVTLSLGSLVMLFVGIGLSVMRTKVTSEELHVQYGLWGPRVPIDSITACNVVPYDWKEFGGWGIKRSRAGVWSYTPTLVDRVVSVSWTDERGKNKRAVFAAEDPEAVAAAIRRARTLPKAVAAGKVRVDVEAVADGIIDAEFEPQSEGDAAAKRKSRD